ncbi:SDR family oxidoreductase [Marivita sp. S0852]|uniref:SDR family oxidoreductase n=1 Tax=Marivita sp. S0852 TaxID=3373893 RepID=UPI0039827CBB
MTQRYLDDGWQVTGVSRGAAACVNPRYTHLRCPDFSAAPLSKRLGAHLNNARSPYGAFIHAAATDAGVGPIDSLTDAAWDLNWSINVRAAATILRHLLPGMKAKGGAVVLVSSQGAEMPLRYLGPYCVTKAALSHMARCYAAELRAAPVTVNAVGVTFEGGVNAKHRRHKVDLNLRRSAAAGTASYPDVAENLALFEMLTSPEARHISGQYIEAHRGQAT